MGRTPRAAGRGRVFRRRAGRRRAARRGKGKAARLRVRRHGEEPRSRLRSVRELVGGGEPRRKTALPARADAQPSGGAALRAPRRARPDLGGGDRGRARALPPDRLRRRCTARERRKGLRGLAGNPTGLRSGSRAREAASGRVLEVAVESSGTPPRGPFERNRNAPRQEPTTLSSDVTGQVANRSHHTERLLILLFCLCGALRVWVFAAAFPFFSNVDEPAHFDMVVRYSLGRVPHSIEPMVPEAAHYLARYASPEYLHPPERYPGGRYPRPPWTLEPGAMSDTVQASEAAWRATTNHEVSQAPLYYSLAAAWMGAGRLLGFGGAHLLYWVRFLNVFLIAGVVLTSFAAARSIFPDRRAVRLGVPMLVAFLPQDTFYAIQSDVLSPLCFGVAFVFLVKLLRVGMPGYGTAAIAGGAVAATALVKSSNLPLVAVAILVLAWWAWRSAGTG
ncbi:MAG: DUF2142 domain-containing protein, partial [Myxococcales bacterium]